DVPAGEVGVPYRFTPRMRWGRRPYSAMVIGTLPPGLSLDGLTLTGTPREAGSWHFRYVASDSTVSPQHGGPEQFAETFILLVNAPRDQGSAGSGGQSSSGQGFQ